MRFPSLIRSHASFASVCAVLALIASAAAAQTAPAAPAAVPAAAPATTASVPLPTTSAASPAPTMAPTPAVSSTATTAGAQAKPAPMPSVSTGKPTISGVLIGSNVNIRKGPGTEYPIYFTAPLGYPVQVIGKRGDWLEIEFPGTSFSYVAKQYIQKIDENTGMVTAAGVSVRSGPGTQYDRLYVVPVGHKFRLLGMDSTGQWYQVAPMAGETAWILREYVKIAGAVPASEGPVPAVESSAATATAEGPGETAAPKVEEKPDPMAEKLGQAEQLFNTETAKENPAEWDLATLENMYTEIAANSTSTVNKALAKQRLAQLDAYEAVKAHSAEIGKVGEDLQKRLGEIEQERQRQLIELAKNNERETPYAATGTVEKFYIRDLGGATHKLVNGETISFLLKSEVCDLSAFEGKRVGVKGTFITIPGQNVRMIDATSAAILPAEAAPAPAEAPAAAAPAPEPAPEAEPAESLPEEAPAE